MEILSPDASCTLASFQNKTFQPFDKIYSKRTAAGFCFDFNIGLVCGLAAVAFHLAILKSKDLLINSMSNSTEIGIITMTDIVCIEAASIGGEANFSTTVNPNFSEKTLASRAPKKYNCKKL